MPPTTQLRLAPSDDHHLSSSHASVNLSMSLLLYTQCSNATTNVHLALPFFFHILALFPGPAQLSVACTMEKREIP